MFMNALSQHPPTRLGNGKIRKSKNDGLQSTRRARNVVANR
jgi:hypothetical protein